MHLPTKICLSTLFLIISKSAAACINLSGHYIIENNDVHDITYDTVVTQTNCSEIKMLQTDGAGDLSITSDWQMDDKVYASDSDTTTQATWLGDVASRTIKNSDPAHNENSSEIITYQLVGKNEIKRTLDLYNADSSHDHFEQLYKRQ